jgi:hypothetical protein
MSTKDPHYLLKQMAEQQNGYDEVAHGEFDHDQFAATQALKSILHPPVTRMNALNDLDNVIGANDGTSLRQKSQLLDLRRKLGVVHSRLCKIGK